MIDTPLMIFMFLSSGLMFSLAVIWRNSSWLNVFLRLSLFGISFFGAYIIVTRGMIG